MGDTLSELFDSFVSEPIGYERIIDVLPRGFFGRGGQKKAGGSVYSEETDSIGDKMYKDILSKHKQDKVINRMVNYKNKHFKEFSNYIIDFSTTNNILQVKSQPPEEYFKSIIIKSLVTIKKAKK